MDSKYTWERQQDWKAVYREWCYASCIHCKASQRNSAYNEDEHMIKLRYEGWFLHEAGPICPACVKKAQDNKDYAKLTTCFSNVKSWLNYCNKIPQEVIK